MSWVPLDDTVRRFTALTKEDMRRLPVLQNQVLRLKYSNSDLNTPTVELLKACGDLSVHQLGAFYTVMQIHKTVTSGQSKYFSERFLLRNPTQYNIFPRTHVNTIKVRGNLTLSRSGFIHRGAQLWNPLPSDLRNCPDVISFKIDLWRWIVSTVAVKPWRSVKTWDDFEGFHKVIYNILSKYGIFPISYAMRKWICESTRRSAKERETEEGEWLRGKAEVQYPMRRFKHFPPMAQWEQN